MPNIIIESFGAPDQIPRGKSLTFGGRAKNTGETGWAGVEGWYFTGEKWLYSNEGTFEAEEERDYCVMSYEDASGYYGLLGKTSDNGWVETSRAQKWVEVVDTIVPNANNLPWPTITSVVPSQGAIDIEITNNTVPANLNYIGLYVTVTNPADDILFEYERTGLCVEEVIHITASVPNQPTIIVRAYTSNYDNGLILTDEKSYTSQVCSYYTNQTDCENASCYWWSDNTCHDIPEVIVDGFPWWILLLIAGSIGVGYIVLRKKA